jgi:MFS family permease
VTVLRALAGLVCGAAVAALGALILGEFEFSGLLPYVAGALFGLVVGVVVVGVGRDRSWPVAVVAGALAAGGIAGAGWIDSSEGIEPVKGLVWVSAALAAVVAVARTVRWRPTPERPRADLTER